MNLVGHLRAVNPSQPLMVRVLGWRGTRFFRRRPIYFSKFQCPYCGKRSLDQMPRNASVYFYDCTRCNKVIRPKPGLCCVYCSYGDVPCPPKQGGAAMLRAMSGSQSDR